MTSWTDFIKKYAASKGLSYGCAMSDPAVSAAYKATKPPEKAKKPLSYKAILKKGLPKEPKAEKPKTKKALQKELASALSVPSFV